MYSKALVSRQRCIPDRRASLSTHQVQTLPAVTPPLRRPLDFLNAKCSILASILAFSAPNLAPHKHPIRLIIRLLLLPIPNLLQKLLQLLLLAGRTGDITQSGDCRPFSAAIQRRHSAAIPARHDAPPLCNPPGVRTCSFFPAHITAYECSKVHTYSFTSHIRLSDSTLVTLIEVETQA